jgi:NADH:ubiquinone oxidoreductase subunit 4 (subunit M)
MISIKNMLIIILVSILLGIYFLTIIPPNKKMLQRHIAVISSFISFLFSIHFWFFSPEETIFFEFASYYPFIMMGAIYIKFRIILAITPFFIIVIILITFLNFACIFYLSYDIKVNLSEILMIFLYLDLLMVSVVLSSNCSLHYFMIYI